MCHTTRKKKKKKKKQIIKLKTRLRRQASTSQGALEKMKPSPYQERQD